MPDCHRCGAAVEVVEGPDGKSLTLDVYESFGGPHRWTVDTAGVATELDQFVDIAGQTEHRFTCSSGAEPGARPDTP
jgi:hypothetical protein